MGPFRDKGAIREEKGGRKEGTGNNEAQSRGPAGQTENEFLTEGKSNLSSLKLPPLEFMMREGANSVCARAGQMVIDNHAVQMAKIEKQTMLQASGTSQVPRGRHCTKK